MASSRGRNPTDPFRRTCLPHPMRWLNAAWAVLALGQSGCEHVPDPPEMKLPPATGACALARDSVVADDAVGATWIPWTSPCLPDARVAYVDRAAWNVWVMDEEGGHRRCLTCAGENALGVDFPLDSADGSKVSWKGDPEAHPTRPILLFKAENENSAHRVLRNSPSIGWDNDIWAVNVCTRRFFRLVRTAPGQGVQHSAMSEDGKWYVYPLRYRGEGPESQFQHASMVFGNLEVDEHGDVDFVKRFERKPLGEMYYEPNDIHQSASGRYSLFYVAGRGEMLDPFRYDWCAGPESECTESNTALAATPGVHEEFLMVSPSGRRLAWMRGPVMGYGYRADLFLSSLDFGDAVRVTWYNDCDVWPGQCLRHGGQLSRLEWSGDGRSLYVGLWEHGSLLPFRAAALHRLEFAGPCGGERP